MARGNARQRIFREDRDYQRFLEGIEATIDKFAFEIFGFVCMPNRIHLFFRTPESNFGVDMAGFTEKRSALLSRDVAAWLARRLTTWTMRELAGSFGLRHPDSVANLTRRADRAMKKSPRLRKEVDAIRRELLQVEK